MALIADNIRYFRKQQNISQTEFAQIFGITRASVGAYEEGRAEPKLELLLRFSKYYNVSLSDFIEKNHTLNTPYNSTGLPLKKVNETSEGSLFIPESLDNKLSSNSVKDSRKKGSSTATSYKTIPYYRSATQTKKINPSEWPIFQGCDAVFECTPYLEKNTDKYKEGTIFITTKLEQDGDYNGVFIQKDGSRLYLIDGLIHYHEDMEVWKVMYKIESINT